MILIWVYSLCNVFIVILAEPRKIEEQGLVTVCKTESLRIRVQIMFQWNIWKWPWNYDKRYSLANVRFWNFVDISVRSTLKKLLVSYHLHRKKKSPGQPVKLFFALFKLNATFYFQLNLKKTLWPLFYGWGSTASRLELLQGGSLPFTTKFPDIPGMHFINLGRMKDWV